MACFYEREDSTAWLVPPMDPRANDRCIYCGAWWPESWCPDDDEDDQAGPA